MRLGRALAEHHKVYDFIVVGSGCGSIVARRLAEKKGVKVLLLEAGDSNKKNPILYIPLLSVATIVPFSKKYNWRYESEEETFLDDRKIFQPRGKVLGGSSMINGMIWVRGHPNDYDSWGEITGDNSWKYEHLLQYFKKSENFEGYNNLDEYNRGYSTNIKPIKSSGLYNEMVCENSVYHGYDGPLHISRPRYVHEISQRLIQAAIQKCKLEYNGDFCGPKLDGFGPYHMNQKFGRRWGVAQGYLDSFIGKHPQSQLDIITNARVDKIIFKQEPNSEVIEADKCVSGVTFYKNCNSSSASDGRNAHHTAFASKEVILSAGVFGSPQILNLTGIGDKCKLDELGIKTNIVLPGVGKNLIDHVDIGVTCNNPSKEALGVSALGVSRCLTHFLSYLKDHGRQYLLNSISNISGKNDGEKELLFAKLFMKNLFMSNGVDSGGFARSSESVQYPDLQFHFFPGSFRNYSLSGFFNHSFSTNVYLSRPESRGEVNLKSKCVFDYPLVTHNFLKKQNDVDVLLKGVKIARKIMSSEILNSYRGSEIEPGRNVKSDRDLEMWLRQNCKSAHHPVGTCKMGQKEDPLTVVDSRLRVLGTKNLRIVDGSIFPTHVTGNPWSTIVAIAEKASAIILSEHAIMHK